MLTDSGDDLVGKSVNQASTKKFRNFTKVNPGFSAALHGNCHALEARKYKDRIDTGHAWAMRTVFA